MAFALRTGPIRSGVQRRPADLRRGKRKDRKDKNRKIRFQERLEIRKDKEIREDIKIEVC